MLPENILLIIMCSDTGHLTELYPCFVDKSENYVMQSSFVFRGPDSNFQIHCYMTRT